MGSGGSKKNLEPEDKWVSYQIHVLNNNKYSILIFNQCTVGKIPNLVFDYCKVYFRVQLGPIYFFLL